MSSRAGAIDLLRRAMNEVGFVGKGEHVVESQCQLTESVKYAEKAYSCLHLISEEDFQAGLRSLQKELSRGPIAANLRTCAVWGRKPT